jgi:hypothetical protein
MIPTHPTPRHGIAVRIALAVTAVLGAFLIVFPLAIGLPGKSAASGDLMSAMRPQMSDAALAQGRTDLATVNAMAQQMNETMIPTLATQLKATPEQLQAFFGQNLPALAKGINELPQLQASFGGLQATMQAQQANFRQADQIPTGFLPPTTMTVLFVVPGVLLLGFAGFGLLRPARGRQMVAAAGITGLVMSIGLLATSMYGKASAADEMTAAFKPVFAAQSVQQARSLTNDATAMSNELTQSAVPTLASALHVTPTQLAAGMATSYPAVVTGMQALPGIVQRMQVATSLIESQADNFAKTAAIPWEPGSMVGVFWAMMAPAILLIAVGAGTLLLVSGVGSASTRRTTLRPGALHH